MAPLFEDLYGRRCHCLVGWFEFLDPMSHDIDFLQEAWTNFGWFNVGLRQ